MNIEEENQKLKKQVEDLQYHIEQDDKLYSELEEKYYELNEKYNNSLKDVYNFIDCCEQRNTINKELSLRWTNDQKTFLEEYLNFFNN